MFNKYSVPYRYNGYKQNDKGIFLERERSRITRACSLLVRPLFDRPKDKSLFHTTVTQWGIAVCDGFVCVIAESFISELHPDEFHFHRNEPSRTSLRISYESNLLLPVCVYEETQELLLTYSSYFGTAGGAKLTHTFVKSYQQIIIYHPYDMIIIIIIIYYYFFDSWIAITSELTYNNDVNNIREDRKRN